MSGRSAPGGVRQPRPSLQGQLARHLRTLGIALSLILLVAIFASAARLKGASFLSAVNLQTMASHSVIISLGAVGMTLIIVSGGIDLSVGSVIALSMVVTAWSIEAGLPLSLAALLGVLTGAASGLLNGLMITGFRIVPFIATLGMMGVARGLAKLMAKSQQINIGYEGWYQSWLYLLTTSPQLAGAAGGSAVPPWLVFSPSVWLMILLAAAMALVLRRTVFGRHAFAIGSNEAAARLCGVNVPLMKVMIYSAAGLFTGLSGVVLCSRQAQGDPTAAIGYELDVIAAVVIGGGSLSGGEGSILGSLIGALIMIVLRTGLRMVNAPAPVQEILIGAIIIIAVVVDQLQHPKEN